VIRGDTEAVVELAGGMVNHAAATSVAGQRTDQASGPPRPASRCQSVASGNFPDIAKSAVTVTTFTTDPMVNAGERQVHTKGPWSGWPVAIDPPRKRNASQTWKWRNQPQPKSD